MTDILVSPKGSSLNGVPISVNSSVAIASSSFTLTAYHLIVKLNNGTTFCILYPLISRFDRRPAVSGWQIYIETRHFYFITAYVQKESETVDFFEALQLVMNKASIERLYAFSDGARPQASLGPLTEDIIMTPLKSLNINGNTHSPASSISSSQSRTGGTISPFWNLYNPTEEYGRLGIGSDSSGWRLSTVNAQYQISPTYPRTLAVPRSISDAVLYHAAKFRSKGRIPALSYVYPPTQASVTRCSQPLVGIKQKRSIQDEKMIEAIFSANKMPTQYCSIPSKNLIMDARPSVNAIANQALGAGFESTDNYKDCKRKFMGIENIHVMRNSLKKVRTIIYEQDLGIDRWNKNMESTEWMRHVQLVLEAGVLIKDSVLEGTNVLVHCSDGWDRTAQLTSVAQLCLDPYYRTIRGFIVLIEKEWLSFGHKFQDRCGLFAYTSKATTKTKKGKTKEVAPIFQQFLDCTYQIMLQFPISFQFTEQFLIDIFDATHSGQFGTFVGNCEKERGDIGLAHKTQSVWSLFLNDDLTPKEKFVNPLYMYASKGNDGIGANSVLDVNANGSGLRFWNGLFDRNVKTNTWSDNIARIM